jgi:hypothetical protein
MCEHSSVALLSMLTRLSIAESIGSYKLRSKWRGVYRTAVRLIMDLLTFCHRTEKRYSQAPPDCIHRNVSYTAILVYYRVVAVSSSQPYLRPRIKCSRPHAVQHVVPHQCPDLLLVSMFDATRSALFSQKGRKVLPVKTLLS